MTCNGKNSLWSRFSAAWSNTQFRKMFIVFIIGCMLIFGYQYAAWMWKVYAMPPADYAKLAVDLKVTKKMRYGYILSWHGAYLVKTDNKDSREPVDKNKETGSGTQYEKNEEQKKGSDGSGSIREPDHMEEKEEYSLEKAMLEELKLVPIKTVLETALYLTAFLIIFWGPSWLVKLKFLSSRNPFWRDFCGGAISGAIHFWVMAMPVIMLNYGQPLFSTWIGPGALSCSSGLVATSYGSGMTISYRMIVEVLIFWPRLIYLFFAEMIPNWAQPIIFFGIVAPSFNGLIWGAYRIIWMDFRQKKWRNQRPLLS